jgi:short-subunit dehydrogenase
MTANEALKQKYGPWALVTGASSGIGEQFARRLAAANFHLLLVARREEKLRALQTELTRKYGIEVELLIEDLGSLQGVDNLTQAVNARDIGLVVSNAGFGLKGAFNKHPRSTLESMLNLNVRTPLLLLHALLPTLRARPTAGIILVGSQEGEAPFPWSSAYAAGKAFLHSLGMGLYGELAGTGVDILVLAPGATATEAHALQGISTDILPGVMSASEVAKQGLQQLGKTPLHIPGKANRKFINMMRRMPRGKLISFNAENLAVVMAASGNPVK